VSPAAPVVSPAVSCSFQADPVYVFILTLIFAPFCLSMFSRRVAKIQRRLLQFRLLPLASPLVLGCHAVALSNVYVYVCLYMHPCLCFMAYFYAPISTIVSGVL